MPIKQPFCNCFNAKMSNLGIYFNDNRQQGEIIFMIFN